MQRQAFGCLIARKMLLIAISNVKQKLEDTTNIPSVSPDLPNADGLAPQPKRQQLPPPGVTVLSRDDRRDMIYEKICLPRPCSGNLVYSVPEAINVVNTLGRSNDKHPPRLYLAMVKEKMMNKKRAPVKRCQLNCILKAAKDGSPTPVYWNARGRPDIISLEAMVKHAALMFTVGITERLCTPKTAACEAAETSICGMLSFVCILLNAMACSCPGADSAIQCISPHLYCNSNDIGIYSNWRGDRSCKTLLRQEVESFQRGFKYLDSPTSKSLRTRCQKGS